MEAEIYADKNIRVTTSRIIVGNTTYALRNITSVSTTSTAPDKGRAHKLLFFSALGVIGGITWFFVGNDSKKPAVILALASVGFVAMAINWSIRLKPSYHLMITSSAQEADALSSYDKSYISTVTEKINEAIAKCDK